MEFLDKRILGICNELKKLSVKQNLETTGWLYKEGFYLRPQEAEGDGVPFEPFDPHTMHWFGPDKHYWFRLNYTVPAPMDGKDLWLAVRTQIEEWDDAKNPQFLLFVNNIPVQGLDMNHREALMGKKMRVGEVVKIDMQAYSGTLHTEFNLIASMQERSTDILALYYDLQVPLWAFGRMQKESKERMNLERVLNKAVNLLDLRTPHSKQFDQSVQEARSYLQEALYTQLAGHGDVVASCIGHTHIDVAWWWTVAQTREKVGRSFSTVLQLMDEYPEYKFMSSQPQLYAFLKERYPELYTRVQQQIADGRWEAEGGMWVEADCNLTSGESLVRQFLYGKNFFMQEFGVDNRILWLPDVFGYSGALPQIMKKSGIDYFMTTKLSWNQYNKIPNDTFMWRGIDGTEVLSHLVTTQGVGQNEEDFFTTYNGALHPDAILGGWHRYQNKDINNDILITYGYGDGGGGPTREMLETGRRMEHGIEGIPRVRQAFARTYFDELAQRVQGNNRLPVWEGELYFEYHRGTYTSMARNKRSNRKAEFGLMDLELLCVLAEDTMAYPQEELDALWKKVLINQFHDILPGTSIKEVYEVTKEEYTAIEEEIQRLATPRRALLAGGGDAIAVMNTTGFVRSDIVCLGECAAPALQDAQGCVYPVQQTNDGAVAYVKNIPSKGWASLTVAEAAPAKTSFVLEGQTVLQTPFYTVTMDENGVIKSVFDKENNRQVLQESGGGNLMRMYEDKPIYYDNWDIDIYYTEKYWDALDVQSMEWTEMGPVRATLAIERRISNSTIWQKIHFYANSRRIDFDTKVDWKEHQHLLKVHFPVNVHTDEAAFDVQFGNLTRKVHTNTSWDVARFESCGQKWMDLSEGHYGVSLLNDCKYGYSVKDSNMALTLIKSGIEPNPTTDQEEHVFTYSLLAHAGQWREGGTVPEAYYVNQPLQVVCGSKAGQIFSLAQVKAPNVVLETIKKAADGNGYIVRMYETDNALTKTELKWALPFTSVQECNLVEEDVGSAGTENGKVIFDIKPYEIKTFRIIS